MIKIKLSFFIPINDKTVTLSQPPVHTTQHVKKNKKTKHCKKALKLMKTANITTQYNNIYVIILQLLEKLTLVATRLVCNLQANCLSPGSERAGLPLIAVSCIYSEIIRFYVKQKMSNCLFP